MRSFYQLMVFEIRCDGCQNRTERTDNNQHVPPGWWESGEKQISRRRALCPDCAKKEMA